MHPEQQRKKYPPRKVICRSDRILYFCCARVAWKIRSRNNLTERARQRGSLSGRQIVALSTHTQSHNIAYAARALFCI